jgi:hypothetical protein
LALTAIELKSNNGLAALEVLEPQEIEKAKDIFYRDGFVVIQNALTGDQLAALQNGCDREIHSLLENDQARPTPSAHFLILKES